MKIKVLDDAEADMLQAIHFYEKQSAGLGNYFLDTIMSDIESLHIYAGIHIKMWEYHRLLSKRFPFSIYYKKHNNIIYVYAVLDNRQKPQHIEERLK